MAIPSIEALYKLNEELGLNMNFTSLTADALYDVYAFYEFLEHKGLAYAIPYAKKPPKCFSLPGSSFLFNDKGVPLCPGGLPMRRHGKNRRGDTLYACPVKRLTRVDDKKVYKVYSHECPLPNLCEPDSKLGPIYKVPSSLDPRVHPSLPRNSKKFQQLLKMRSSIERSNSTKKWAYLMKLTNTRVMPYAFIRLVLISIIEHSRVWTRHFLNNFSLENVTILDFFR